MTTKFVSKEVDDSGHFKRQKTRFTIPFGKEGVSYLLRRIVID